MILTTPEIPAERSDSTSDSQASSDARRLDKFYTKGEVARQCVRHFESCTGIDLMTTGRVIIEPSAGAGAFLDHLPPSAVAYDLSPEDPRIIAKDFLTVTQQDPAIVLGNPPFGKASRLAVKFFNHAAGFASHIGFILPRTFEKVSIQNRLHQDFHLLGENRLCPDSFTFEGMSYEVPCVFQVWERQGEARPRVVLARDHPDFSFVERTAADFAFQRVGARAGCTKTEFSQVAAASHHFIRSNIALDLLLGRFSAIDFSEVKARTAGNPSISKTELVTLYGEVARGG